MLLVLRKNMICSIWRSQKLIYLYICNALCHLLLYNFHFVMENDHQIKLNSGLYVPVWYHGNMTYTILQLQYGTNSVRLSKRVKGENFGTIQTKIGTQVTLLIPKAKKQLFSKNAYYNWQLIININRYFNAL